MIVDIIEEIIAESADVLLSHDGLVEDPRQDVADDGAGVIHRPLNTHQFVHLLLADLRPVPPADGGPTYEARLSLHPQAGQRSIFNSQRNLGIGDIKIYNPSKICSVLRNDLFGIATRTRWQEAWRGLVWW